MISAHIAYDGLTERISSDAKRLENDRCTERDDCAFCRSASDVYDKVTDRLGDIDTGADRCSDRLLDNCNIAGSGLIRSLLNGTFFNFRDAARNADADVRFSECAPA